MFYTVFSTNHTPYMQWQSDLLEHSWKRVGQEGVLIRLVATDGRQHLPVQKYAHCIATQSWDVHPDTGDFYPIYNKPASLLEWVYRDRPEGTVLVLDPDCVFRNPVTRHVAPGSPAAQSWVDFIARESGDENPFGLAAGFSFLREHCVRTDLSIAPVMIPILIHTSDLRRICARWLELCGIIRQNYRDAQGEPAWESEMHAYLAACAEYGLQHEPISLGICTNWRPEDVPDAPIIHYCQAVLDTGGEEIFYKQHYKPWTRVEPSADPAWDYGRDLIAIVNEYSDEVNGVVRQPTLATRPKWREGVMEGRVVDDILLELPAESRSLWLNASGKAIWELCAGTLTIGEIGTELGARFDVEKDQVTADVLATVGQLSAVRFLEIA